MTDERDESRDPSGPSEGNLEMREAVSDAMLRLLDRPISDEALHDATLRVSRPLETPDKNLCSLLAFRLGNEHFAVKAIEVDRVTGLTSVRSIPHRSNAIIRGICNVDGEIFLCASLTDLLALGPGESDNGDSSEVDTQRRMVVLGKAPGQWVVEVDEALGVSVVETVAFKPPPVTVNHSADRFTQSLVPADTGQFISLLDVSRVILGFEAALR